MARKSAAQGKVRRWKGGRLRIFSVEVKLRELGPDESGKMLYEVERLDRHFLWEVDAIPFGDGFALEQPAVERREDDPPIEMEYGVRDGRLECLRISAVPDGPPLTTAMLRQLGGIEARVREYARYTTYRLELDEQGEVIGVQTASPPDREHVFRPAALIDSELGSAVRPGRGRPPLSDATLRRVAEVVREAEARRESTARAVQDEFTLTLDAAKKRIRKARDRGFLPPTKRKEK